MRSLLNPRSILLATIVVGVLTIGLRIGDVWDVLASGKMPEAPHAFAQDKQPDAAAPAPSSNPSPPAVDAGKPAEGAVAEEKTPADSTPKPSGGAARDGGGRNISGGDGSAQASR